MRFASLIVLSFNRCAMLRQSLESLFANTSYPFELIVLDDASDAETQAYVMSLVRDRRVSTALFNSDHNMGLGIQFNRGAAIARGDVLIKLDADLNYQPDWLTEVVRLLDTHEKLGCLGLFKYWHEPCHFDHEEPSWLGDHYRVKDFVGSAIAMRREVYDACGPWVEDPNANFAEDVRFKRGVVQSGYYLGLPKEDLVLNVGFGEHLTSLIRKIDWDGGNHVYNVPELKPLVFNG